MTYRTNWFFSALAEFIPLIGVVLYLSGVLSASGTIHGYTKQQLMTYYSASFVLAGWIPSVWYEVGNNIRTGRLNGFLLRPVSYFWEFVTKQFAVSLGFVLFYIFFATLVGLAFSDIIFMPKSIDGLLLFFGAALVAFLLAFQIGFLTHLSAFWFDDLMGFLTVSGLLQAFAFGQLFPLDFLPVWLYKALMYTPFAYVYYFPTRIFLGLDGAQIARGFAVSMLWIVLTAIAIRALWGRGLRRYHARGG